MASYTKCALISAVGLGAFVVYLSTVRYLGTAWPVVRVPKPRGQNRFEIRPRNGEDLSFQDLMSRRSGRLRSECERSRFKSAGKGEEEEEDFNPRKYFLERERKFLWCPVFKASSSNWFHYLVNNISTAAVSYTHLTLPTKA